MFGIIYWSDDESTTRNAPEHWPELNEILKMEYRRTSYDAQYQTTQIVLAAQVAALESSMCGEWVSEWGSGLVKVESHLSITLLF